MLYEMEYNDNNSNDHLSDKDKKGILDPQGINPNPLNGMSYSQKYRELASQWDSFPAYQRSTEILNSISANPLTLISAGTGSGKTVFVPKFALHYTNYQGPVAVTLPKRVVTLSAATYSAMLSDATLGKEIGYLYRGAPKNSTSPDNRIVYMTDGYLVAKFSQDANLSEYKVVIVDEAHERTVRIDLLLLFLRNLLKSGKRPDLRVVIMSATIDLHKYLDYFSGIETGVLQISGQPNFPIDVHFLNTPVKSYLATGIELINQIAAQSVAKPHDSGIKDAIMYFITTSAEAYQACREIRKRHATIWCVEVYADMDKDLKIFAESLDRFRELGNYDQKVILATNVAESSLTVNGLHYVIDSCYQFTSRFDATVNGTILNRELITQAQALQRRGRVGRTSPGVCYHLITKQQFDELKPYPDPDILTDDYTMDLLQVIRITDSKTLQAGLDMTAQLMDPPRPQNINLAKKIYHMYKIVDDDGVITRRGLDLTHFNVLPINQSLFISYAWEHHCAWEACVIVASIERTGGKVTALFRKSMDDGMTGGKKSGKNPFRTDGLAKEAVTYLKSIVQRQGDHLTFLEIFNNYETIVDKVKWAYRHGLKLETLKSIERAASTYYRKILNMKRNPENFRGGASKSNGKSKTQIRQAVVTALKSSHQHLTAHDLIPEFPVRARLDATLSRDSVVWLTHPKSKISETSFVYNQLVNLSDGWEYTTVTII